MPDDFDPRRADDALPDWGIAFARLPLETPPAGSFRRFSSALQAQTRRVEAPRRDRRMTWAVGLASAAVLALVVGSPFLVRAPRPTPSVPDRSVALQSAQPAQATPRAEAAHGQGRATLPQVPAGAQDAPAPSGLRLVQRALPGMERAFPESSTRVDRNRARDATDRLVASLPLEQVAAAADAVAREHALAQLQQQAQQLEALIAMARDERFGTGAGVAMTGELDAALARVDADLQRPDLDPVQRVDLWRQRVGTLEHLAGVTTTQRWLSAHGALDQVALVSVD